MPSCHVQIIEDASSHYRTERNTRSPVSEYIGYIPRDLSRDNWQICRAEVNSFCTEAASRDHDETKGHVVVVVLAVAVSEFQIRRRNRPSLTSPRHVFLIPPCRCSKILYASARTYNMVVVCSMLDPTSKLSFVYVPHRLLRIPISLGFWWSLRVVGPPKTRRPISIRGYRSRMCIRNN